MYAKKMIVIMRMLTLNENSSAFNTTDIGCKPNASQNMQRQRVTMGIQEGANTPFSRTKNHDASAHILRPDIRDVKIKRT